MIGEATSESVTKRGSGKDISRPAKAARSTPQPSRKILRRCTSVCGFTMGHGDPAYAKDLLQRLKDIHNVPVATVAQNANTYNPAAVKLQELLVTGKIVHPGNKALNWMASNLTYSKNRRGEVTPRKGGAKNERRYKIDGMVALLMAIQASIITPSRTAL